MKIKNYYYDGRASDEFAGEPYDIINKTYRTALDVSNFFDDAPGRPVGIAEMKFVFEEYRHLTKWMVDNHVRIFSTDEEIEERYEKNIALCEKLYTEKDMATICDIKATLYARVNNFFDRCDDVALAMSMYIHFGDDTLQWIDVSDDSEEVYFVTMDYRYHQPEDRDYQVCANELIGKSYGSIRDIIDVIVHKTGDWPGIFKDDELNVFEYYIKCKEDDSETRYKVNTVKTLPCFGRI